MEIMFRLTMVLVGFLLAFLSLITLIHSSHYVVAVLLMFGGVLTMFGGLPNHE
jgi:uncharacterized membrane protein YccC